MRRAECTVVVEHLSEKRYRGHCPMLADCEAIRPTAEEARRVVELALDEHFRKRAADEGKPTTMNAIDQLFANLRAKKRKAFMPFIVAGDPDLSTTSRVVDRLVDCGADLIEVGFPYSDPIADGPTIQASYTRALEHGIKIDEIFKWAKKQKQSKPGAPLVGMVSFSIVHRRNPASFLDQAQVAGFDGAIVPDLPIDEAETLSKLAAERDFKLIHLITPTTPPARAVKIARLSTGFLYCVSVTGITGERDRLPAELLDQLRRLRKETDLPLCVGFGVSKPEHVQMLRDEVDGIIVGSALVRKLADVGSRGVDAVAEEIGAIGRSLVQALNP